MHGPPPAGCAEASEDNPVVNRKRAERLMHSMGLAGPGP